MILAIYLLITGLCFPPLLAYVLVKSLRKGVKNREEVQRDVIEH